MKAKVSLLPSKLTSQQRYKLKMKKLQNKADKITMQGKASLGKSIAQNVKDAAVALGTQASAARVIEAGQAKGLAGQYKSSSNIDDALAKYMSLMNGDPAKEGSEGESQTGATTDMPTSKYGR